MNCRDVQEYCVACAGEEIPAEMKSHMVECKDCREAYEAALMVAKLMSLKKYEVPDPGFEARSLARIRTSLYQLEEERAQKWSFWKLFDAGTVSSVRYVMAAMVLFLGGLYMVSMQSLPALQPGFSEEGAVVVQQRREVAKNEATQPSSNATDTVVPGMLAFSNNGPGRVEYGPGPSIPVSFETP